MISQSSFVVVDTETTGLVPALDKIIELGAVKVVNGEIRDEFFTLINPGIFVPSDTTNITGITSEMLSGAPDFTPVGKKFLNFLGANSIFVAHNVAFDRDFLNCALSNAGFERMMCPYLCTIEFAKYLHPNLSKYNLGSLVDVFGIDLPRAHRAIHDARATAHLLIKFLKTVQNGGAKTLQDIPVIQNLPKNAVLVENQISLF